MSENKDLETISLTDNISLKRETDNLIALFNKTLSLLKEDKQDIDDHYENLQKAYMECRGFSVVSEDGILEKAINDVFKNKNEMAKRIERISDQLTKLMVAKMGLEAAMLQNKEDKLTRPINISALK